MNRKQLFKAICTSLMIMSSVVICFAQMSGVQGKVRDLNTGEALISATVAIGDIGTFTNTEGEFQLPFDSGEHLLEISYVGYDPQLVEVLISEGNMLGLDVALEPTKMMLETATITGSKYDRAVSDSPVSINVLSPSVINNTNTIDVSTIIDKVPGVQMIDGQANIRGGSGYSYGAGSRVMLLVDEMPALQVDAGKPLWGDMPIENISQVEVIKGASSVLYGSSALNGIIHIRTNYATSKPVTKINSSFTSVMAPPDPTKQWWDKSPFLSNTAIMHKRKIGRLDLVAHGNYRNESKYYLSDNGTIQSDDDLPMYARAGRVGLNLRYRISDKTSIGLNNLFTNTKSTSPFLWKGGTNGAYKNFRGAINEGNNTRYYLDPTFIHYDKSNNRHKVLSRLFFVNNKQTNDQSNRSTSSYVEYQFQKEIKDWGLSITSGISTVLSFTSAALYGDTTFQSRNIAAYGQVEKTFKDRLTVLAGVRVEGNVQLSPEEFLGYEIPEGRDEDAKFIARTALNYQVGNFSYLRASFGQGYRYPTITERFITTSFGGLNIFPNPDLEPETGWSTEIGMKQGYAFNDLNGYIDLAGFWSQYDNMMEFTFTDVGGVLGFQSQNVGNVDIKGFEVNLAGRTNVSNFQIGFLTGYTFINPTYRNFENNIDLQGSLSTAVTGSGSMIVMQDPENVLKYRSKHNIKGDLELGYRNFKLGGTFASISHMVNVDFFLENFAGIREYRFNDQDGYYTLDARLSYEFDFEAERKIKLSAIGRNVLNQEYSVRPGLLAAPRSIAIRLDYEF